MKSRIAAGLLVLAGLLACTTTYVGDPGMPPAEDETPCDVDDTRPGCRRDQPMCEEGAEHLCDPL